MKQTEERLKTAFANLAQLPVSTKHTVMLARFIRCKPVEKAKKMLSLIISKKLAVPFPRFNFDLGHKKPHIGPAQYPVKAATAMLAALNSAEKNAINKGLNEKKLFISACIANKGVRHQHTGRKIRQRMKRTRIFIEVREKEEKKEGKNQA
ncbi:50S ribosomal protein L22 [archaeon]|nr:50S ribosomal protein L22 [archaeon]